MQHRLIVYRSLWEEMTQYFALDSSQQKFTVSVASFRAGRGYLVIDRSLPQRSAVWYLFKFSIYMYVYIYVYVYIY